MAMPNTSEALRESDPAVVARYLLLRTVIHDRLLARVERHVLERYEVQPSRRLPPTLLADLRGGFVRPGEGELWPVVFLTPVDVTVALCVAISAERIASLGTVLRGPQRLRQRGWEDWWGWESPLADLHPRFFELSPLEQEDAVAAWFATGLEWLVGNGLMRRKPAR
jgi:hypothetical protein